MKLFYIKITVLNLALAYKFGRGVRNVSHVLCYHVTLYASLCHRDQPSPIRKFGLCRLPNTDQLHFLKFLSHEQSSSVLTYLSLFPFVTSCQGL